MFRPASHLTEALPTAIYTRQSRPRSSDLTSCAAQRWICSDFCGEQGFLLTPDVFDDEGESSETLNSPALQRLLEAAEAHEIGRVLVYGIDRLSRKLFHLAQLLETFERLGVTLSVVTDPNFGESAVNRLTSNIIAAASEFQMEITRERLADARTALKSKARRVAGRVPFGYRANTATKQLFVEPNEARVV
jgi:site-specific DNA recombinase